MEIAFSVEMERPPFVREAQGVAYDDIYGPPDGVAVDTSSEAQGVANA